MTDPACRPFRLRLAHGRVFDGWVTAGEAVAIEDQELGLTAAAATPDDLIRGYGGGHIEWLPPRPQHPAPPEQQGERR